MFKKTNPIIISLLTLTILIFGPKAFLDAQAAPHYPSFFNAMDLITGDPESEGYSNFGYRHATDGNTMVAAQYYTETNPSDSTESKRIHLLHFYNNVGNGDAMNSQPDQTVTVDQDVYRSDGVSIIRGLGIDGDMATLLKYNRYDNHHLDNVELLVFERDGGGTWSYTTKGIVLEADVDYWPSTYSNPDIYGVSEGIGISVEKFNMSEGRVIFYVNTNTYDDQNGNFSSTATVDGTTYTMPSTPENPILTVRNLYTVEISELLSNPSDVPMHRTRFTVNTYPFDDKNLSLQGNSLFIKYTGTYYPTGKPGNSTAGYEENINIPFENDITELRYENGFWKPRAAFVDSAGNHNGFEVSGEYLTLLYDGSTSANIKTVHWDYGTETMTDLGNTPFDFSIGAFTFSGNKLIVHDHDGSGGQNFEIKEFDTSSETWTTEFKSTRNLGEFINNRYLDYDIIGNLRLLTPQGRNGIITLPVQTSWGIRQIMVIGKADTPEIYHDNDTNLRSYVTDIDQHAADNSSNHNNFDINENYYITATGNEIQFYVNNSGTWSLDETFTISDLETFAGISAGSGTDAVSGSPVRITDTKAAATVTLNGAGRIFIFELIAGSWQITNTRGLTSATGVQSNVISMNNNYLQYFQSVYDLSSPTLDLVLDLGPYLNSATSNPTSVSFNANNDLSFFGYPDTYFFNFNGTDWDEAITHFNPDCPGARALLSDSTFIASIHLDSTSGGSDYCHIRAYDIGSDDFTNYELIEGDTGTLEYDNFSSKFTASRVFNGDFLTSFKRDWGSNNARMMVQFSGVSCDTYEVGMVIEMEEIVNSNYSEYFFLKVVGDTIFYSFFDESLTSHPLYSISIPTDITDREICNTFEPPVCTDRDGDGYSIEGGICGAYDCDDTNITINPGATEICNGLDNNCDGVLDIDEDGDGVSPTGQNPLGICLSDDCDDTDSSIGNPIGSIYYFDDDGDGYGDNDNTLVDSCPQPDYVAVGGDCDDSSSLIYPGTTTTAYCGASECYSDPADPGSYVYNGQIYDGNGDYVGRCYNVDVCLSTGTKYCRTDGSGDYDVSCTIDYVLYEDNDLDTFGAGALTTQCYETEGYSDNNEDCDDTDDTINPDATEVCDGGIDNNCDGLADGDADGDGYDPTGACSALDCDDSDPAVTLPTGLPAWSIQDGGICSWDEAEEGVIEIHQKTQDDYYNWNDYWALIGGLTNGDDSSGNNFSDHNGITRYYRQNNYTFNYTFLSGEPTYAGSSGISFESPVAQVVENNSGNPIQGDENSTVIPLGFKTIVYGKVVDSVIVNANGLVFLNNSTDLEAPVEADTVSRVSRFNSAPTMDDVPTISPYELENNVVIAGKWFEYEPDGNTSAPNTVFFDRFDEDNDGNDDLFVVHFDQIYQAGSPWEPEDDFQVKIYARNNIDCFDEDGDGAYVGTECDSSLPVDCDDNDATRHPSATESCDGIDSNCDGSAETDADGDGFYGTDPDGVCTQLDCNDDPLDPLADSIYPGAPESCDGVDTDCGGETEVDADGDGWSPAGQSGGVCQEVDCDDSDPLVQGPSSVPQWYIDAGYDVCGSTSAAPDGRVEIHQPDTPSSYLYTNFSSGITNGDDSGYANLDDQDFENTPSNQEQPGAEAYYFENGNAVKRNITLDRETLTGATTVGFETNYGSGPIPLGFETKLYGKPVDTVYISSNGAVYLNESASLTGSSGTGAAGAGMTTTSSALPANPYSPDGDIMVAGNYHQLYGGTLDTTINYQDATISYKLEGTAPNRVFIVDYDNVYARRWYYSYYNRYYYYYPTSFQIKIYETGGTIPQPTIPDAPVLNPVSLAYNGSAALNWTPPANDGNVDFQSPITNYKLRYGEVGSSCGGSSPFDPADTVCSYVDVGAVTGTTITGLSNGTAYEFVVFAENRIGLSPPSNPQSVTPQAANEGAIEIHLGNDLNPDGTLFTGTQRDRYYTSGISNGEDASNLADLNFLNQAPTQSHIVDAERYEFNSGNPQRNTISLNIETLNNPNTVELDDDTYTTTIIPLGFETLLYGKSVDSMIIGSNGYVYLNNYADLDGSGGYTSSSTASMDTISMTGMDVSSTSDNPPNNILAAGILTDLDPGDCSNYNYSLNRCDGTYSPHGTIKYKVIGSAPNRVMIVHFDGVSYYSGYGDINEKVNFQIKIFESHDATCTDNDGDGAYAEGGICGPQDCNDNDPSINPSVTGSTPCSIYNGSYTPIIIPEKATATTAGIDQLGLYEVDIDNNVAAGSDEDGEIVVFTLNSAGEWEELITATLPNTAIGKRIVIQDDYIIVSDPDYNDTSTGSQEQGGVWIYRLDPAAPSLTEVEFFTHTSSPYYHTGSSLSATADYIAIGTPGYSGEQGAITVLKQNAGTDTWNFVTNIQAGDAASDETYLAEHALDMNDEWIAAGSNGPNNIGGVYVYQKQSGADSWPTEIKLLPGDMGDNDFFGTHQVKFSADYLFASHERADISGEVDAGEIIVFQHDGSGNWSEIQRVSQFDATANREFGKYFDVNSETLIAPFNYVDGNGKEVFNIDVFTVNSDGSGLTFKDRLTPEETLMYCWNGGPTTNCDFYSANDAAVSEDYIIAGVPVDSENTQNNGAIWFYGYQAVSSTGGSGGSPEPEPICSATPVEINLPESLPVYIVNGKPEVEINWGKIGGIDSNYERKAEVLFDYLDTDPGIGNTDYKLKNLFAKYIFNEIQNEGAGMKESFENALGETIQGDVNLLSDRNIDTLFTDWWPYLFVNELKSNQTLASAFLNGVKNGLGESELNYTELIRSILKEIKASDDGSDIKDITICMQGVVDDIRLEDYIPGENRNIYASKDTALANLLEDVKENSQIGDVLEAIKNDRTLIENTRNSVDVGINSLLFTWQSNGNINHLIELYESDDTVRRFTDELTETSIYNELENCVKKQYRTRLLDKAKEVYVKMVQVILNQNETCDDASANVLLDTAKEMIKGDQQEAFGDMIINFINDYLVLENLVDRETGQGTPFDDYYSRELNGLLTNYVDGMNVSIYRNGQRIHKESNPQITQFIDSSLPVNETGRVKYHEYHIVTETECASKKGDFGKAKIDPVLKTGTPVSASADIRIRIKDSYSQFFMDKLEKLLKGETGIQTDIRLSSYQNTDAIEKNNTRACLSARQALYIRRNSENALSYIKNCWGNERINPKIDEHQRDIVPPFLKLIMLSGKENLDEVAAEFIPPALEKIQNELFREVKTISETSELRMAAEELLKVSSIDGFTEAQKEMIMCGGIQDCDETKKKEIEQYFHGESHATDITVEVYDPNGTKLYDVPARTNIFGEINGVELGILESGTEYTFKVRLVDEPYALPKIRMVTINNAQPVGNGQYIATVDLINRAQFRYGNFDNSDDEITLNDIVKWGELLNEEPEKWQDANVDGFTGIDLFDATTIQENWGLEQEISLDREQITYQELVTIFGYRGGSDKIISIPGWINPEENSCLTE
jgi:hypothetical protein